MKRSGWILVGVLLLVAVFSFYLYERRTYNWEELISDETMKTKEYQLRIYPHYWANRTAAVTEFFQYLEEITSLPFLSTFKKSIRVQHSYNLRKCFPEETTDKLTKDDVITLRIRQYVYGDDKGIITIDGKISADKNFNFVNKFNILQPNPKYANISAQKIEQDIHPCHDNHSREIKLKFNTTLISPPNLRDEENDNENEKRLKKKYPDLYSIKYCTDVQEFFPYFFKEYGLGNSTLTFSPRGKGWVSFANEGRFPNGIKYKSDLTLKYDSVNASIHGDVAPLYGEFSIRVFAKDDGYGLFDQETVANMEHWYDLMLQKFGSQDDYPCSYPVDLDVKLFLRKQVELQHLPPPSFNLDINEIIHAISSDMEQVEEEDEEDEDSIDEWDFIYYFLDGQDKSL